MEQYNIKLERLTNSNYPIWSLQMEVLLDSKDLFDEVIKLERPPVKDEDDEVSVKSYNVWFKKNKEAYSLLILNISPEIAMIYKGIRDASKIWSLIKERFEGDVEDKTMNLFLELTKLKKGDNENVDGYITRAQGLCRQISELGKSISERELVRYIVEGLPDTYQSLSASLIINRGIKLSQLRQTLLDFENRMSITKPDTTAFHTSISRREPLRCYICKRVGHLQNDCWYNPKNNKSRSAGYNDRRQLSKDEHAKWLTEKFSDKECALMTDVRSGGLEEWHLDSACTSHMTNNLTLFYNKVPCVREIKVAENERSIQSLYKGNILATSTDTDTNVRLEDVLYVPDLRGNLLSVSKMVQKGNTVTFNNCGVKIYKKTGELISSGSLNEGIFTINFESRHTPQNDYSFCFKAYDNSTELWHRRFGHINIDYLKKMEREQMVIGLEELKGELNFCESCSKGKIARMKGCDKITENVNDVLERIHVDLCGPMRIETLGGRRYMMVIVDQFSRRYFVELLRTKDETSGRLRNFIERRENETNRRVKIIRTDNGLEFINEVLYQYFERKGIKHEKTEAYSPRSNGVAERANRTLLDLARTMLIDSNLPLSLWGEAVSTAAYLYNLTPCKSKMERTPYELWKNRKPSVRHLKVFGCQAVYKIKGPHRHKLQPKGRDGIHVGYSQERRAYRIFDPEEKRVYETIDVQFNEQKLGLPAKNRNEENYLNFLYLPSLNVEKTKGNNEITKVKNVKANEKGEDSESEEIGNHIQVEIQLQRNIQEENDVQGVQSEENVEEHGVQNEEIEEEDGEPGIENKENEEGESGTQNKENEEEDSGIQNRENEEEDRENEEEDSCQMQDNTINEETECF